MSYRDRDNQPRQRSRSRSRERSQRPPGERRPDRDSNYSSNKGNDRGRDRDHRDFYQRDDQYQHQQSINNGDRRREGNNTYQEEKITESNSVMIRGLPPRSTEPSLYAALQVYAPKDIRLVIERETGDCRGFAFVEFLSIEHAVYFMALFPGSTGDPNGTQLIIDGRAVTLSFSKDDGRNRDRYNRGDDVRGGEAKPPMRSDWICEKCQGHNFSRRTECYKCTAPKTDNCVYLNTGPNNPGIASQHDQTYPDTLVSTHTPNPCLAVRGLSLITSEDQLTELFRMYVQVKSVLILRDRNSGMSRGLGLVEFYSTDHASYVLGTAESSPVELHGNILKLTYARPAFVAAQIAQMQEILNYDAMMMQTFPGGAPGMAWTPAAAGYPPQQMAGMMPYQTVAVVPQPTLQPPLPASSKLPPNFETHGGLYVFQPQSGYFLDPVSEFYYDPKSKLYYNSFDGAYYSYDPTKAPPYVLVQPPMPQTEPSAVVRDPASGSSAVGGAGQEEDLQAQVAAALARKPVIISMGGGNSSKNKPIMNRKIVTNLAKWESVRDEGEEESEAQEGSAFCKKKPAAAVAEPPPAVLLQQKKTVLVQPTSVAMPAPAVVQEKPLSTPIEALQSNSVTAPTGSSAVTAPTVNASAASLCLLCRRQFASAEQLLRHEKESKLHAENLAKQQASSQASSSASSNSAYRDRASERRAVQGDSIPLAYPKREEEKPLYKAQPNLDIYAPIASSSSSSAAPVKTLKDDLDNPGNAMLRKMGWAGEGGLGKGGAGIEDPVDAGGRANSKAGVGVSEGGPVSYPRGEGQDYKDSVLNATRQRYEQLNKKGT